MNFCDELCLLCNKKGEFFINFSRYHKFCIQHSQSYQNESKFTCQHCSSESLIVKELLKCSLCKTGKIMSIYGCGHKTCSECLKQCFICQESICGYCNKSSNSLCINHQDFCLICRKEKRICNFCNNKGCDCNWERDRCINCENKTCKKCRNVSLELTLSPCNHKNCLKYKHELLCGTCMIENGCCSKCKIHKEKCVTCSTLICDCNSKNHRCTKAPKNNMSVSKLISGFCDNCLNETLDKDLITHTQCNHKYCKNCNLEKCYKCFNNFKRTGELCMNCKSPEVAGRRICDHPYCKNCECEECGRCNEKCIHCSASAWIFRYSCDHAACYTCRQTNENCKFFCVKCKFHQTESLINTKCKLNICRNCTAYHRSFENCRKCKKSCDICKEPGSPCITFHCNHTGCEKCNKNIICLKCLLESNDYDKT